MTERRTIVIEERQNNNIHTNKKILKHSESTEDFQIFLRILSKKGFYGILKYVNEKEQASFKQIQKYAMVSKIVPNQASILVILNGLTNLELLERTNAKEKSSITVYTANKKGKEIFSKLLSIRELI